MSEEKEEANFNVLCQPVEDTLTELNNKKGFQCKVRIISRIPNQFHIDSDDDTATLYFNDFTDNPFKKGKLTNKLFTAKYTDSHNNHMINYVRINHDDINEAKFGYNMEKNITGSTRFAQVPLFNKGTKKDHVIEIDNVSAIDESQVVVCVVNDKNYIAVVSVNNRDSKDTKIIIPEYNCELIKETDIVIKNQGDNFAWVDVKLKAKFLKEKVESTLLTNFIQETKNENLYYSENDLKKFHTAMKSDGLTILAGLSGTGKSQLIKCYANALNLPRDQVKFISVESNWTDDSDLLGFYDYVNKKYQPGKSGLVKLLRDADGNSDKLYIVVFDEMNLSKVEQYFSQFLSVLEMDEEDRVITLYDSGNGQRDSIKIGSNVLFVGTINTDESTYKFSDKVLDRSNVIHLEIQDFTKIKKSTSFKKLEDLTVNAKLYNQLRDVGSDIHLDDNQLKLLWNMHKDIHKADPNVGIGWRIVKQISNYLDNLPEGPEGIEDKGLDWQINQRILTKIRGSKEQLGGLLGVRDDSETEQNNIQDGLLYKDLDDYLKAESNKKSVEKMFVETVETLEQKAKDLDTYGFTI